MADIKIRPVTDAEFRAFTVAISEGFSGDMDHEVYVERDRRVFPLDRTLAAFDGTQIVGTFGGLDLRLTVPGQQQITMEGTTIVTVFPTHRRMGLLREMMGQHLEVAYQRGDAVAGLWSSSSDIYDRFGYGIATHSRSYTIDGDQIAFRAGVPVERIRRVSADVVEREVSDLYERVALRTPGMFARTDLIWRDSVLADDEWRRKGQTSHRYVVHDGLDGVDGYAIYRQKASESSDGHPSGTVSIIEVIADTPVARASLWAYLTRIDGCPNVRMWNAPLTDPLSAMVVQPRRLAVTSVYDALWIRILDVSAALGARGYETDGSLVFEIQDPFRPATEGVYRLTVNDGVARCERTDEEPDLRIDIDVLGALYLGGGNAYHFADAGRVVGSADALRTLHRVFRTDEQPWCNWVF
ncbi:MAG: GNAT family N-acetyltransferase [Proteobacteria bacterium]|nr:GNAT family N-acetyltransferase [Pseudomonadota bacterium]